MLDTGEAPGDGGSRFEREASGPEHETTPFSPPWSEQASGGAFESVGDLLRHNRVLLGSSLVLLGAAIATTLVILSPDGPIRARAGDWGPGRSATSTGLTGYPADRRGKECGLRWASASGAEIEQPLPGCHSYQAPEVVAVGGRWLVVWEHEHRRIAVSALQNGPPPGEPAILGETVFVERPRSRGGTLQPRTAVLAGEDRIAIWYRGGQVVTVGAGPSLWPGGPFEVAAARLGPRAFVLLFGIVALMTFYLVAAGWTLVQPSRLRRSHALGHTLEAELPPLGTCLLLSGRPHELDCAHAWTFGANLDQLAGRPVTLVLTERRGAGDAYRRLDRLRVSQVWMGSFEEAVARARALRAGTVALAMFAASVLLFGLNAYLIL